MGDGHPAESVRRQRLHRGSSIGDHVQSNLRQILGEPVDVGGHVEYGRGLLQFHISAAQAPLQERPEPSEGHVHPLTVDGCGRNCICVNAQKQVQPTLIFVHAIAAHLDAPGPVIAHEGVVEFPGVGQYVERRLGERIGQHQVLFLGLREGQDVLSEILSECFNRVLAGHTNPLRSSAGCCSSIRWGPHAAMETE